MTRNLTAREGRNDLEQRESATQKQHSTLTIEGRNDRKKGKDAKSNKDKTETEIYPQPRPRKLIGELPTTTPHYTPPTLHPLSTNSSTPPSGRSSIFLHIGARCNVTRTCLSRNVSGLHLWTREGKVRAGVGVWVSSRVGSGTHRSHIISR